MMKIPMQDNWVGEVEGRVPPSNYYHHTQVFVLCLCCCVTGDKTCPSNLC